MLEFTLMSGRMFNTFLFILMASFVWEFIATFVIHENATTLHLHTYTHAFIVFLLLGMIDWIAEHNVFHLFENPSLHTFVVWVLPLTALVLFPIKGVKKRRFRNFARIGMIAVIGILLGYNLMELFSTWQKTS